MQSWSPSAVPPASAAAYGGRRNINKNKRAAGRLPRLLHRLFFKVLRLLPSDREPAARYHRTTGSDEEYRCYYYYSCGVLASIPEEELVDVDDGSESEEEEEGVPDAAVVVPAALGRKAGSERFVVGPTEATTTVVHVEVLL